MKRLTFLTLLLSLSLCLNAGGKRILFIGDSITDGGWGKSGGSAKPSDKRTHWDMNHIYGHGYMFLCAAHYQAEYPERPILCSAVFKCHLTGPVDTTRTCRFQHPKC